MRLLILGGTSEATRLAAALASRGGIDTTLSLAGRTARPAPSAVPVRVGGFGGSIGLEHYLRQSLTDAVVDATHPFAARISANATAACRAAEIPLLAFSRPPWEPGADDRWTSAPTLAAAVNVMAGWSRRRVFLTTGRLDLVEFCAAPHHRYLVRTIDPPDGQSLPPDTTVVLERGPFNEVAERTLMQQHAVEWLVTKNSGGGATAAKLAAARTLGIPVLMIARPTLPPRPERHVLGDVLAWIDGHAASSG